MEEKKREKPKSLVLTEIIYKTLEKFCDDGEKRMLINELVLRPHLVDNLISNLLSHEFITSSVLKLISHDKLFIEELDGSLNINESSVFKADFQMDIYNIALDEKIIPTAETFVDVYEMQRSEDLYLTFSELSMNLNHLVLTEAQIIRFCEKYEQWLRGDSCPTFFLMKTQNNFVVLKVFIHNNIKRYRFYKINSGRIWRGEDLPRIVVPRLAHL